VRPHKVGGSVSVVIRDGIPMCPNCRDVPMVETDPGWWACPDERGLDSFAAALAEALDRVLDFASAVVEAPVRPSAPPTAPAEGDDTRESGEGRP
jgi:hypothetical protein